MELFGNQTKKILGLDIGTNSIGASLIEIPKDISYYGKYGKILWMGSRIIPVDADYLNKFEQGQKAETKAANRRKARSSRRLKFRYKLRRERLTKVFKILGWVPENLPFDKPKLIKQLIRNEGDFYFKMNDYLPYSMETYKEFYKEFGYNNEQIDQVLRKVQLNEVIDIQLLPEDWIIYFLRKKALREKISIPELVRIIYLLNQRRGFKSGRKDLQNSSYLNYDEFIKLKDNFNKEDYSEEIVTRFVSITKVKSVTQVSEDKNKSGKYKFKIEVEDKRVFSWEVERKEKPNWEGKEYQFIVEQKLSKNGEIKQTTQPKIAEENEWELVMLSLDNQIANSNKHVGEFFFDKIKEYHQRNEIFKIRQNVIKRERYISELEAIWNKQVELRKLENNEDELLNRDKIEKIAETLYKHNLLKQKEIKSKNLIDILIQDIIYYQRELKSQKSLISECRYEKRIGVRKNEKGEFVKTGIYGLKGAPVSSPYFQEFRIWQDIHNLKIIPKDVTKNFNLNSYLNHEIKEKIFEFFDTHLEVTSKNIFDIINTYYPELKLSDEHYKINLFKNRDKLKGNETKFFLRKYFKKYQWKDQGEELLKDAQKLKRLWSILYCINSFDIDKSKKGISKALKKFFPEMPQDLISALAVSEEFEKKYAALSAMAIKKLLPLMKCGKYWNYENLANEIKEKISKIIEQVKNNKLDKELEPIKRFIKENNIQTIQDFQGLPTWVACYLVYGRHSESEDNERYDLETIKKLDILKIIKQSKLVGNPLVKKIVLETLCLVRDLCLKYGQPDEIHIELARELKKNSEEKRLITEANNKHKEEKEIIKKILEELLNESFNHYDENGNKINQSFTVKPNPNSLNDIELFRLYKNSGKFEWNNKLKKNDHEIEWENLGKSPTKSQIETYILWLSQRCVSPYTGKIIPLSKLFDSNYYEKEHIIPRSKLKNDSFDNLVISETGVNKAKGNELAANFIKNQNGICEYGGTKYQLLKYEDYENLCKSIYKGKKLKNLLATEVPEDFISRQINDTRYIGRKLGELLKPFAINENGIIFTIGSITGELKKVWGLDQVWNQLLLPRFERMESMINQPLIFKNETGISFKMNGEILDIKRYDHRHHALDSVVIAATTREHVRYLNTLSAADSNEEIMIIKKTLVKQKFRDFILPWSSFLIDVKEGLEKIIPTFKVNKPIVSLPYNKYTKFTQVDNGIWKKVEVEQAYNPKWLAVRRSIFNQNPLGIDWIKQTKFVSVKEAIKVQIDRMLYEENPTKRNVASYIYDKEKREIIKLMIKDGLSRSGLDITQKTELLDFIEKKILNTYKSGKGFQLHKYLTKNQNDTEITEKILIVEFVPYKVKRVKIDSSFTADKISKKIPYSEKSPFAKLLLNHLQNYTKPSEAFSPEGLEKLTQSNNGKPIKTIRVLDGKLEELENVYGKKYWETGPGAIAYSVIYQNIFSYKREYESIPTHVVLRCIHENKPIFKDLPNTKKIVLQSDDLVYVPTDDEWQKIVNHQDNPIDWSNQKEIANRIYRLVKSVDSQFYFLPANVSMLIMKYDSQKGIGEFMSQNCSEKTIDGTIVIKERCIKIKVDRLGYIVHYDL